MNGRIASDEVGWAVATRVQRLRLYLAAFLVDATGYAYLALLPVHAVKAFGATPEVLGYLGCTATAVYAGVCFFSGHWSDRVGSGRLFRSGLVWLVLVATPVAYVADGLAPLFVASALFGIGLGLFWPPLQRQLAVLSPGGTLWRAVGTFNCVWAAGIAFGSLGAANMYGSLGYRAGLGFCLVLTLAALVALMPSFAADTPERREEHRAVDGTADGASTGPDPPVLLFLRLGWLANFAAVFAYHGVIYQLPYLCEELGHSVYLFGVFLFSLNAARLLVFFLLRQIRSWHYSLPWLAVLQFVAGGSLLLLGFSESSFAFLLLLPALGAFAGLSYFSSLYYGLNLGVRQGQKSGLHETIQAVGMTCGPLLCGLGWKSATLYQESSSSWPGVALLPASGLLLVVLVLELYIYRRFSRRQRAGAGVE